VLYVNAIHLSQLEAANCALLVARLVEVSAQLSGGPSERRNTGQSCGERSSTECVRVLLSGCSELLSFGRSTFATLIQFAVGARTNLARLFAAHLFARLCFWRNFNAAPTQLCLHFFGHPEI